MRRNKSFWSFRISMIVTAVVLMTFINIAVSEVPPPVYGVDIVKHDESITQTAGTTQTYEATVKNIGVVGLDEIWLGVDRLDTSWFRSEETVSLDFEETAVLRYDLSVPEDTQGLYPFFLVVLGKAGTNEFSNMKIVSLNIVEEDTTTATITPTTTSTLRTEKIDETKDEMNDDILFYASVLIIVIVSLFVVRKVFS